MYSPVTGSGKIRSATAPKPPKRASACFSSGVAGRFSFSMVLSVRMAVRMSWAFCRSVAATGAGGGDGRKSGKASWALCMSWSPSPCVNGPAIGA